jgi:hypothetical protein
VRYWIFDHDKTPQRFPLQRLIRRVCEVVTASSQDCEIASCEITKAHGYGLNIRGWEVALDTEDKIVVDFEFFDGLSQGTEEWFYDLEAKLPGVEILFGLHDSTALFVEADQSIAMDIVSIFANVRQAS